MKVYILSPNADTLFDDKKVKQLKGAGKVVFQKNIVPFGKVGGLFTGSEDRILAIDPDFCDWKVPNKVIDNIPNLKSVVLQTTSFSWIDVDYIGKKGIPVVNLRGFSTIAVAEWALMMAVNLARKIPLVIKDGWKQDYIKHQGVELRGKTAGIIGLGNIGTAIAENCQGFGMKVQYWSKTSGDKRFKRVGLETLMKTSDFIFPVVAQNDKTQGLIADKMLRSMKNSAIFISIVHHVYNHDLLVKMVNDEKLYGYGFEAGKPDFLKYKGNVWAGPEIAWCTEDSMKKNAEQWVQAITSATKGKYPNRVN